MVCSSTSSPSKPHAFVEYSGLVLGKRTSNRHRAEKLFRFECKSAVTGLEDSCDELSASLMRFCIRFEEVTFCFILWIWQVFDDWCCCIVFCFCQRCWDSGSHLSAFTAAWITRLWIIDEYNRSAWAAKAVDTQYSLAIPLGSNSNVLDVICQMRICVN
jgi:hypothetical protein